MLPQKASSPFHLILTVVSGLILGAVLLLLLPLLLLFILVYAFFAPVRLRSTLFRLSSKRGTRQPAGRAGEDIDVDCTVLKSEEVETDRRQ